MKEILDCDEEDVKKYEAETGKKAKRQGQVSEGFKKWLKGDKVYQYPGKLRVSTYISESEKLEWEHFMNLEGIPSLSKFVKKSVNNFLKIKKLNDLKQNKDVYRDLNECISSILLCLENSISEYPNIKMLDHLKTVKNENLRMKSITDEFFRTTSKSIKKVSECDILIVEDHKIHLEAIEHFYTKKGLSVEKAMSADAAKNKLKSIHPRMILMDLGLPDMPGEILCKKLKQDKKYNDVKIVIFSAKDIEDINLLLKEVKANDFIPKPLSLKDLETILKYLDNDED